MAAGVLCWILAWSLFAFGAVYDWSLIPAMCGVLVVAIFQRPAVATGDWRGVDRGLLIVLLIAGLQLVPLPISLRNILSPGAVDYQQRVALTGAAAPGWAPLSLVPGAWLRGVGVLATATTCFWVARTAARSRGARLIARAIAWMGFVGAFIAIIQPALSPDLIYGFWKPITKVAHPAGPIVNRNHFAAWMILALPVTAGYLGAHVRTHWMGRTRKVQILADGRALWLVAAGALMTAGLFVTHSRSGVLGFATALVFVLARSWGRLSRRGRLAAMAYVALLVVAVAVLVNLGGLIDRFDQALAESNSWGGRPVIWRETIALIGRFWLFGIGLGGFDVVMAVYQTATHDVLFNHAHNAYLNVLAEGGLVMVLPMLAALVAFVRLAARRLTEDRSPLLFVREGALAGLAGLAVQSLWEVPTLTPGVFLLGATLAGLAVSSPLRDADSPEAAD